MKLAWSIPLGRQDTAVLRGDHVLGGPLTGKWPRGFRFFSLLLLD